MDPIMDKAVSRDGTPIAYWHSGDGPALALAHGTTADHTRWETVLPLLEPHRSVHAMDRRGRCASGDAARYAIEEEAFDVAAVVDAIADATGGPVDVLGHSHGAICALEASLLTTGMRRLVLYEPPVTATTPPGWLDRLDDLLAQGRREDVVVTMLVELAGLTPEELALSRADPSWPGRVAAAHTVVREVRAVEAYRFEPARFRFLAVPTLLLDGGESPPFMRAATAAVVEGLPGARVVTLAGQAHVAQLTAPELFCSAVLDFLDGAR